MTTFFKRLLQFKGPGIRGCPKERAADEGLEILRSALGSELASLLALDGFHFELNPEFDGRPDFLQLRGVFASSEDPGLCFEIRGDFHFDPVDQGITRRNLELYDCRKSRLPGMGCPERIWHSTREQPGELGEQLVNHFMPLAHV
jgi:hypothetical protein